VTIVVLLNEKGNPPGKLADVELHFNDQASPLYGLRLVGFAVWERGTVRSVSMPSRQYTSNGERRSYVLLRPTDATIAGERLTPAILAAYAAHAADAARLRPSTESRA
jgi:hypothetical protein